MGIASFDSFHGFFQSIDIFQRQKKIADALRSENADIIVLQEVHTYHFLNLLKNKLSSHPYVAFKPFIFGPRGGMVTFSKLPIKESEYINFKKRGSLFNSSVISHIVRNGVLLCRLKDTPMVVMNVHATPNLDHDHKRENRFEKYIEAQLSQIATLIKKFAEGSIVVVAGDLNTAKDEPNYNKFINDTSLKDLFADHLSPTQHQEFLPQHKKVKRIDYILVAASSSPVKNIKAVEIFTQKVKLRNGKKRYLSDHIGLRADFIV